MFVFLFLNVCLFIIGNFIYTLAEIPLFVRILISELSFILLYTFSDKAIIKYGVKFVIWHVIIIANFILPIYSFLFYSFNVQAFSITISILAVIVNSLILKKMITSGINKIMSSRISTTGASIVEIILFSALLHIGIKGAIITAIVRLAYIYIFSKIILRK